MRPLRVFLCHASNDKPKARALYKRLKDSGVEPWLDEENLIPGQEWELEIPKAVKNSDIVIVCLTKNSINKEGYVQKEINFALEAALEKPESTIFLIPARFEDCDVPDRLKKYQWVDLFENTNYTRLEQALELRAETVGAKIGSATRKANESEPLVNILGRLPKFNINFAKKSIICPYCLAENRFTNKLSNCANCKKELPVAFIQNYRTASPLFMQIIGFSQSGKTTYLQAMYLMLSRLRNQWSQYYLRALTNSTLNYLKDVNDFEASGRLPYATQLEPNDSFIVQLNNMQRWGNRTLIIRDTAGEQFQNLVSSSDALDFSLHIPTSFFMFSLPDMSMEGPRMNMRDLLLIYLNALDEHKIDPKNRNIIITFSKADIFANILPQKLKDYLVNDPLFELTDSANPMRLFDVNKYLHEMKIFSQLIGDWCQESIPSARSFVGLARNLGINIEYSIISSLGKSFSDDLISIQPKPGRVLDPLFMALELNSKS